MKKRAVFGNVLTEIKSLSNNHIKILQGRKQNGQEIARARPAVAGDDFKFSFGAAVVGVTDMSVSLAAPQSLGEGKQSAQPAHALQQRGGWLGFPRVTQSSQRARRSQCREAFRHTTPQLLQETLTHRSGKAVDAEVGGGTSPHS